MSDFIIINGVLKEYRGIDRDIIIPSSVKVVGENAFYKNDRIEKITFSEGVNVIQSGAFYGCHNLCIINFPSSLVNINDYAFCDCVSIIQINMSNNNPIYYSKNDCLIEKSSNTVVLGCKSSKIPNGIKKIGPRAFSGRKMVEIIIPNTVEEIGDQAFINCSGVYQIDVPRSCSKIGTAAFARCKNLHLVQIPNSVFFVGSLLLVESGESPFLIAVEHIRKPLGWAVDWNYENADVFWGASINY